MTSARATVGHAIKRMEENRMADRTSERGLGSPNMDEATKKRIQSAGGKAQPIEAKAEGGRKGGAKSRRSS